MFLSILNRHFCLKFFKKEDKMRLKEMRTEWGLTKTDVAKAIGTSQRNIGRWESGLNEPTSSSLVKLADFFRVSVDYLLGREDDFGNIEVKSSAAEVSAEELGLISGYRSLSAANKKIVFETMLALGRAGK